LNNDKSDTVKNKDYQSYEQLICRMSRRLLEMLDCITIKPSVLSQLKEYGNQTYDKTATKQNLVNDLVTTFNYDTNNIEDITIPGLSLELKPYQKAAVGWMIQRENIMRANEDHPM